MANDNSTEGASPSQVAEGSQEVPVQINIKTLDSQVFTFCVDKKTPIPQLKDIIANTVGVPSAQQRLIFRGKVLKDDHILSAYHVEDGDTLHLVARQPAPAGVTSEEGRSDGTQGNDTSGSVPRHRIGHSVVLGLNVSDQGENNGADLPRIIGSILSSLGIGTANNVSLNGNANSAFQGVATGAQGGNGSNQSGHQPSHVASPGAFLNHMVVPDSFTTLHAFINRMEQILPLHSGNQQSAPSSAQRSPTQSFPPTSPDALINVVERAQQLLSGPAVAALSHLSGRLARDNSSTELGIRGQVQAEALHVGAAMQQLGSLLLELGRTISTFRMGESAADSMVNAGPAVYISSSGPNPIMVQPVSHQAGPLFALPFPTIANVGVPEVSSVGDAPRIINIRMRGPSAASDGTGGSRGNAEASHQRSSNQSSNQHPAPVTGSGSQVDGNGPLPRSSSVSEIVAEINDLATTLACSAETERTSNPDVRSVDPSSMSSAHLGNPSTLFEKEVVSQTRKGSTDASSPHAPGMGVSGPNEQKAASTSTSSDSGPSESSKSETLVPKGLGLGGLQPKKRSKQANSQPKDLKAHGELKSQEDQELISKGQEVLQSLMSQNPQMRSDSFTSNRPSGSYPVGLGSSQDPQQNLGGMLSGMLQQMMPVVSQALSRSPSLVSTPSGSGPIRQPRRMESQTSRMDLTADDKDIQVDLHLAVEGMENDDAPENIFSNVIDAAGQVHVDRHTELSEALSGDEELCNQFMDMLRRQLRERLQSGHGHSD